MNEQSPQAAASGTFLLGSDLAVHRLGYGTMRLVGEGTWGEPADPAGAHRVLRRAVELGVNLLDTADAYGPEIAERLIAEALHPYPPGLIIATKGGITRQGPAKTEYVGRAGYLLQCIEMSLRRLKLDCIDLYQLHRFDEKTPMEETLGALKKLQEQGKIRHIGLSEVDVATIKKAQKHVTVVSVQNLYNIGDRKHEDVVDYCEKEKIGFIPWFPMAGGDLAKPGGVLDRAAKKHNATVSQLALAWLLHRSPVQLPIPGTSSVQHLEENTAAASLKLSESEWKEIETAAK